jgi:hypothetical protein
MFAGSGMARNFISQSRSAWLDCTENPASGAVSAPSDTDGIINPKASTTAAKRRMQFLSRKEVGANYIRQDKVGFSSFVPLSVLRG